MGYQPREMQAPALRIRCDRCGGGSGAACVRVPRGGRRWAQAQSCWEAQGPSQGRTQEGVPRALGGCQGLLWPCMTATLRLVFQSGQWGQGWDGGGTKIRSQTQCCSP